MNNRLLLLTGLIFLTTSFAYGQQISADRPGAGFGTFTVPAKTLYLESGVALDDGISDVGQLFLRTGIAENFEVQLGVGSLFFIDGVDKPRVAVQSLALKYGLGSFADEKLNLSLFSRTNLPFFNDDYEYYLTRFMILGDYVIKKDLVINLNFGYGDFVDELNDGSFNFSLNSGFSVNEKTNVYYGYTRTFNEQSSRDLFEGGIQYFVNDSFQLDGGFVYSHGPREYLTFGFAKRF